MRFIFNDTTVNVYRHSYHLYNLEEGELSVSGDRILELYYNFDDPDAGCGSVGDEFIHLKDVVEWLQGMEKVEEGKIERFEKFFFQGNATQYFLKLTLETADDKLKFQLSISDGLTDDYINIEQLFSKEEWKTISDEFRTWNELFPYQLGDYIRTVKDKENGMEAGKIGIIKEIFVNDYLGYSVEYGIAIREEGWNGPFWDEYVCDANEIELIGNTGENQ